MMGSHWRDEDDGVEVALLGLLLGVGLGEVAAFARALGKLQGRWSARFGQILERWQRLVVHSYLSRSGRLQM